MARRYERHGVGGRPPRNLREIVDVRADGTEVTVIDRIVEALRAMGMPKDAAARVGVSVDTLREWRRIGEKARLDLHVGDRRWGDLNQHERDCLALANRADQADAEARLHLTTIAAGLARGGMVVESTTERLDKNGNVVSREVRRETALPNPQVVTWLLAHRWPEDFGGRQRLEVTGADGGPVQIASPIDMLAAELDRLAAAETAHADAIDAAVHVPPQAALPGPHGPHAPADA